MNIEEENLKRTLAEKPLLQKSRWCSLGFHIWEQWSNPYLPGKQGNTNIQHRYCASCHKMEARKILISSL